MTPHPPDLTIDDIMATIRQQIQPHQSEGVPQPTPFPASEEEERACPEELLKENYQILLSFLLHEMRQTHPPQFQIKASLSPSRLDKLPLIGLLWHKLRYQLHGLVIFYANKVVQQTAGYYLRLASLLNLLVHQNQACEAEMADLKQRLAQLEAELARLEQNG